MRRIVQLGLVLVTLGGPSVAAAATSLSFGAAQVGIAQIVDYTGMTDSFDNGNSPLSGLTARSIFTLNSIEGNTYRFAYSIANTSSAPVTSSRISLFGFNVSPNVLSADSTGEFNDRDSGNVPMLGDRDLCFGTSIKNCAGGGGTGVTIGEQAATGLFNLTFAAPQTEIVLSELFVRYQSLDFPGARGKSGVGSGTVFESGGIVPEPATWALLIGGFGAVGIAQRRARKPSVAA